MVLEVPGASKEDLEVSPGPVEGSLSVRIQSHEALRTSGVVLRNERNSEKGRIRYERVIPVAWDADAPKVRPSLADGILTLVVPKKAAEPEKRS